MNGLGVAIVSTSQGVMTDRRRALPVLVAKCSASWCKERTMSRVGKLPISVPSKVDISIAMNEITVIGPDGHPDAIGVDLVKVKRRRQSRFRNRQRQPNRNAMSGTMRALVANMVTGVERV